MAERKARDAQLADYRSRRQRSRTPEPFGDRDRGSARKKPSTRAGGDGAAGGPDGRTFVIQEHHARRLHWDFRLERHGVLVSWAVPKGLPETPDTNHLAVQTEDHPLDYGGFEGEIPAGEYGAGRVLIFDHGTYETEKWGDREIKVVLHGDRVRGRYVLFRTRDTNWMVHRMDPPADPDWTPVPEAVRPMLATTGDLPRGRGWAFEFAWNGRRAMVRVTGGQAQVRSARGVDITAHYPELRALGSQLGATQVLLDGEIVALDHDGRPHPSRLKRRSAADTAAGADGAPPRSLVTDVPVTYLAYDLLHLDGRSLLDAPYRDRRAALDDLTAGGPWQITPWWSSGGREVLRASAEQGLPGIVAKRAAAPYQPGRRTRDWVVVRR